MFTIRLAVTLAVTGAVALAASTSEACPLGVSGIADPGSTVCGELTSTGTLYCDVADAGGNFYIHMGVVPPSTGACLPAAGQFTFFEVGCEGNGMSVDRDDAAQQYGGDWLDIRCDIIPSGGGSCDRDGIYSEGSVSYPPTSATSILMCQCNLLDPTCGIGTCIGGAYMEGAACPTPVGYPPSSVVSQAMCGGATIDPDTCDLERCDPYATFTIGGVCDAFSTANGTEVVSPSAGLSSYISTVSSTTSRNFDVTGANRWLGHTFSGIAPQHNAHICGAVLSTTLGKGVTSKSGNDTVGLMFVDSSGTPTGPSYYAYLTSFGISGGSYSTITLDIGLLPGGSGLLAQMESGWLDFIVEDDSAVDCVALKITYCCEEPPDGPPGDPPTD